MVRKKRPPEKVVAIASSALSIVLFKLVEFLKERNDNIQLSAVWFSLFYFISIVVVILYYTGWLQRHRMEWIAIVLAVLVFPAVIYL